MNVPTDTPSTDGAPEPEQEKRCGHHDTILTLIPDHGLRCPWCFPEHFPEHRALVALGESVRTIELFGLRVVPEDRPAQCPNCGSTDPRKVGIRPASPLTGDGAYSVAFSEVCSDPWHAPAGVPVLDDDTRREVEALIVMLTQNSFHLTQTEMNLIAELLADAYLGGTDGR